MTENATGLAREGKETGQSASEKNRPRTGSKQPGFFLLYIGVIHPLLVLGIELTTGMCANDIFDPVPTVWHVLLVAAVPAGNLLVWLALRELVKVRIRTLATVNGITIGIAFFYTVVFLPLLPVALPAVLFLVGLLPLAPLLSLIAAVRQHVYLQRLPREAGQGLLPATGLGLGIFLMLAVALHASAALTRYGMHLAASGETRSERSFGIKLLRTAGNERTILRYCYGKHGLSMDVLGMLLAHDDSLTPEKAREIYYRVTGVPFNSVPVPRSFKRRGGYFRGWSFDPAQGGNTVAGRIRGLSLHSSRIDGSADADAALACLEWTLVFKNDSPTQQEARAQVMLPPGGVVSRLTLWIDGEEREAVFAGRGKVRRAYKRIVRKKRDPVLVTRSGPDQVLVQCFPVPRLGGTMKVRLGITVPLELEGREEVILRLPSFVERNFDVAPEMPHLVWIEAKREIRSSTPKLVPGHIPGKLYGLRGSLTNDELADPATLVRATRSPAIKKVWTPDIREDAHANIVQTLEAVQAFAPERVVVVVDGSVSMRTHKQELEQALSAFPRDVELSLLIASDEVVEPTYRPAPADPRLISRITTRLSEFRFMGGRDNVPALTHAWDLAATNPKGAILWIHGAQPVALGSVEKIAQRFQRRPGGPRLYDLAVSPGPDRIREKLVELRSIERVPRMGTLRDDLERLFSRWGGRRTLLKPVRKRVYTNQAESAPDAKKTSDHLARLWAYDRIQGMEASGKEDSRKEAMQLAVTYRLVTGTTGAVVLENPRDYKRAGLTPPEAPKVPTIPEPETWALMIVSLLALAWAIRRRGMACAHN